MDSEFRAFEREARLRSEDPQRFRSALENQWLRQGRGERVAVISDIHGNFEALSAVLRDIEDRGCDFLVCLGDLVGYGADPIRCVELIRERADICILGNHDAAAIGIGGHNIHYWGAYAKDSMLWTRKVLRDKEKYYLASLPLVDHFDGSTFVHGSLYHPELFDYIQTSYDAYLTLQILETERCFVGHSHVPICFFDDQPTRYVYGQAKVSLRGESKSLINVGSVGQPRDDNPKAAYALFDRREQSLEIRRLDYDIEGARQKILRAGLSTALAERLIYGR